MIAPSHSRRPIGGCKIQDCIGLCYTKCKLKLNYVSSNSKAVVFDAVFVSGSRIRDSSNRQPLCQVLQKSRYTAANHTRDIFFISLSYTWATEE